MKGENYIPNARTPEEHLSNCQFQLRNVDGWLHFSSTAAHRDNAHTKAKCLLCEVELLVAAFEAEARNNLVRPSLYETAGHPSGEARDAVNSNVTGINRGADEPSLLIAGGPTIK